MRLLWTLLGALILTAATLPPAHAAKRDWKAEKVAKKAKQTVDASCAVAEGVGDEAAAAAVALQTMREEVGKTLEARGQLDLLYWRGVLSHCLEDDGSALNDFNTFLVGRGDAPKWQDLADDATRRIAELETYEEPPEEKKTLTLAGADPRLVTVAGLGGGSLLFGILSGAAWGASQQQAQVLYTGAHVGGDMQTYLDEGQNAANGSAVMGVSSLITGAAAGAVALILFKPWQRTGGVAVVPVVVPQDQGVGFHLTGEW